MPAIDQNLIKWLACISQPFKCCMLGKSWPSSENRPSIDSAQSAPSFLALGAKVTLEAFFHAPGRPMISRLHSRDSWDGTIVDVVGLLALGGPTTSSFLADLRSAASWATAPSLSAGEPWIHRWKERIG